jgi:hypothetical protein
MNSERGCVLIGVKKANGNDFVVEGVKLTDNKKRQIFNKFNDIRDKNIFPHRSKG